MSNSRIKKSEGGTGQKLRERLAGNKNTGLTASKTKLYLALCFAVPFLLMTFAFAFNKVFPFGDQQILVTDFWQQYFPFYTEVQDKLHTGQSLLYSWDTGMGANFWGIAAYYYASPFNLLLTFVPYTFLREALTLFLLCRIGFAGLFCGVFLKGVFKRNDLSLVFFGTMYALCAFTLGYYWNVMWFDTFALFPLAAYGTYCLVKLGRVRLYVVALAMSLFFNYYIGFFTCIFTAIFFVCLCIQFKMPIRLVVRRFFKIALASIAAIGITAVITIPELFALKLSYSANNVWPSITRFNYEIQDLIGNFTAMSKPNDKEGLPNIYSGYLCVLLFGVFLISRKIKLRTKIISCAVLFFLMLSIDNKLLDFMWHGFHSTNMIPHRFSFIVSFVLVVMAYKAFTLLNDLTPAEIVGMLVISAIVIVCASLGQQSETAVYTSVALTVLYVGIFFMYQLKLIKINVLYILMGIVFLGEMVSSVLLSVETVRTTVRTGYPSKRAEVRACVEDIEAKDGEPFYRMEFTKFYTLNDPPLYQYPGVSQFSSTANVSVTNFLEGIGNHGWDAGNRYYYSETTPLTNAFLDLKYLIAENGHISDTNNWSLDGRQGEMNYYKNERYLSLGFMTNSALKDFHADKLDPLASQQRLFEAATGLSGQLFKTVNVKSAGHGNLNVYYRETDKDNNGVYGKYRYSPKDSSMGGTLNWNYEIPEDSLVFVYASIDNVQTMSISGGEANPVAQSCEIKRPCIASVGPYKKGETLKINASVDMGLSGNANVYVCMFNQELFDKGYELLKDELMTVTSRNSTNIKGEIDVKQDGLLYTSIPFEPGWSAYVDGEKVEPESVDNAMLALSLTKGKHTLEFSYTPAGFTVGLIITIISLTMFALYCFAQWYLKKKGRTFGPLGITPEVAGIEPDDADDFDEAQSDTRPALRERKERKR